MSAEKSPVFTLLAGSLVLNVALLAFVVVGHAQAESDALAAATRKPAVSSAPAPLAPAGPGAQAWEKLKAGSPAEFAARLRDSGFPPKLQRAILAAHLRDTYAARIKALDLSGSDRPFWQNPISDAAAQAALRQLSREMVKTVRDLLGNDDDDTNLFYQGGSVAHLAPAKAADVRTLVREFDERRSDVYGMGGLIGAEQQKKIAALDQEQRSALAKLLTPEEFIEYELRNSQTSQNLRYSLSAFNPTEQEFRAIYALQADYDQRFGRNYGILPPDEQRARSDANRQLTEQIKAVLGPERAEDYTRAQNSDYRQLTQLAARLDLPASTTDNLWKLQRSFEERRTEIYRTNATDAAARTASLTALQQEARAAVTPLIGPRYLDTYAQYGGRWIQNLVPRPAPTSVPATAAPRN